MGRHTYCHFLPPFPPWGLCLTTLSLGWRREHPLQYHVCPKEASTALETATVLPGCYRKQSSMPGTPEVQAWPSGTKVRMGLLAKH